MHPASHDAAKMARDSDMSLSHWLSLEAGKRGGAAAAPDLIGNLHVVPEFLGNRAPFADPDARGVIAGLGMEADLDSLVALYLAGLCGLGYGARQIVLALHDKEVPVDTIIVSGGAGQSALVRQLLADTTGKIVAAPISEEPVLLGSAILGAVASGRYSDIAEAMPAMSAIGETYQPNPTLAEWHKKRFGAFEMLQQVSRTLLSDSQRIPLLD
jgi:D-ribulokinase